MIDPIYASLRPTQASFIPIASSSNLGQSIPGVSRSSMFFPRRIHCLPFVTPGLFPTFVHAFLAYELINVDFPTFGIPTIIALIGLLIIPLFLSRSIFSRHASCTMPFILFIPAPSLALILATKKPFSL